MEQAPLYVLNSQYDFARADQFYRPSINRISYNIFLKDDFGMEIHCPPRLATIVVDKSTRDLSFMRPWLRMMQACKKKNRNLVKRLIVIGRLNNHAII